MDYEAVRDGLQAAIPYNNHVGLEYLEVADGTGVVRLPDSDTLKNHVGSQHAGALFSAGELLAKLDSDGRVEFPVEVEMTDADGNTVAEMTVRWHVRKNA